MRRSWSRIFAITLGLVLVMSILAACGSGTTSSGGNTPTTGSTTIKIGSDLPVSGKDETSGKPAENGAALAIQEANDSNFIPGYKLVFVPKDDVGAGSAHDPSVGKTNVQALVGDALV